MTTDTATTADLPLPNTRTSSSAPPTESTIKQWLVENTSIRPLARCVPPWNDCKRADCFKCAERRAKQHALKLNSRNDTSHSVYLRFSLQSSHDFESTLLELHDVARLFLRSSWLSSNSTSWFRSYEVTNNNGLWNSHVNFLVTGTPEQLNQLLDSAALRWLECAHRVGANATKQGQYAEYARSYLDVAGYVTKGIMAAGKRGMTPGDILREAVTGEDPDSAELWREIEKFSLNNPGFRWVSQSRAARPTRQPRFTLELLNALPEGLSKPQQQAALGCSDGTIAKLRRQQRALRASYDLAA